jgi:hypothetical protein
MLGKKPQHLLVEGGRIFSVHRMRCVGHDHGLADGGVAPARSLTHGRVTAWTSSAVYQQHGKVPLRNVLAACGGAWPTVTDRRPQVVHESRALFGCAPLLSAWHPQRVSEFFGPFFRFSATDGINEILSQKA